MILFDDAIIRSLDINNNLALLLHTTKKCNLNCYGCFNKELEDKKGITSWDMLNKLIKAPKMEYLILSGSEFLTNDVEEIKEFICCAKLVNNYKIIIYTNGTFPDKMEQLRDVVDGFHLDVKLPYWALEETEADLFQEVMGVSMSDTLINKLNLSLRYLDRTRGKYDLVRTVKYPQVPEEMFEEIRLTMECLYLDWKLNPFVTIE